MSEQTAMSEQAAMSEQTTRTVLIAGIGNIFLGDDAFGVEVAQRLARRPQPDGVRVVDFGIRGFDLAYALMDGDDAAILVDALSRGHSPGTLYVFEPDLPAADAPAPMVEAHSMDPVKVLRMAHAMGNGSQPQKVLVVGCEPATFGEEEGGQMGLSPSVAAIIDDAVELVESVVADMLSAWRDEARGIAADDTAAAS